MNKLKLTLLGGVTAVTNDGPPLHFRTDKIRALLVYLALEGERPRQRQSLAALLWPEMPEQTALKNLRQSLHRLQQTLDKESPGLNQALFTITRQTVQCDRTLLEVDALNFQTLLVACERHPHRHLYLCHDCLDRLAEAATLYQGELLAGFSLPDAIAFEEWLLFWRERLQQQAIDVLGQLAVALIERDEVEAALGYARRQVVLDPFREEAYRLLMSLLARSGQQSKALAQYRLLRQLLRDELGVEPAAATTALYQQIQAEQRGETAVSPTGQPSTRHHFPVQFTPFIGRQQELAQIEELFLDPGCRLLTLIGPGGIGKSRLSLRVGEQLATKTGFADDIYFLPLAAAQTAEALLTSLLNALNVTPSARSTPQDSLLNHLRDRRCLLILDNFEQLVEHAPLLVEMLAAAPGLRLLVTSQLPLNVQAEQRLTISGLDYPAADETAVNLLDYSAIHLFVESARHVAPAFRLTAEHETAVIQICRLVQGMPLALGLAAAWVRVMDCAAIADEIGRSLDFLSLSPQDKPSRHQSMAAVFAYAWQLLPESEQDVLGQLAVFRGPFNLEAFLAVTEGTPLALARLLDRSLAQRRQDGHYELHELLRHFVNQETVGRHAEAARRHSDYYLKLVAAQEKAFYGPQPRQAVAAIQSYLDNFRQAWRWAVEHGHRPGIEATLEAVGRFYQVANLLQEGEAVFAQAIEAFGEITPLLIWHAYFLEKRGQHGEAIRQAQKTVEQAGQNEGVYAAAVGLLGKLLPHEGRFEEAREYQQQAINHYQVTAEVERLGQSLRRMAIICWRAADYGQALHYFHQAIPLHQALQHKSGLAQIYSSMGGVYWEQKDVPQALSCVEQARELYESIDDKVGAALVASNLSILYEYMGQYEQALAANRKAIEISQESGDRQGLAMDLSNHGWILYNMGDLERSLDCYFRALDIARELRNQWGIAYYQTGIASVYEATGDEETALRYYDLALPVLLEHDAPYYALGALMGKAKLLYRRGQWTAARALNEQAETLAAEAELAEFIEQSRALAAELDFVMGEGAEG